MSPQLASVSALIEELRNMKVVMGPVTHGETTGICGWVEAFPLQRIADRLAVLLVALRSHKEEKDDEDDQSRVDKGTLLEGLDLPRQPTRGDL